MKVEEVGGEKLMMLNEEQQRPVLQQLIVKAGQYSARFFVNGKPLCSCLPIPELTLLPQPYSQEHSTKHLVQMPLRQRLST